MDPLAPAPPPATGGDRLFLWLFSAALIGLFGWSVLRDFGPARFGAVVLLAAWLPLTALHELGHALVARAFGWRVIEVAVGLGPRVARFAVGETQVEIRLWPLAGHVLPVPARVEGARLASTCIYLAGPLAELAVIGAVACAVALAALLVQAATNDWVAAAMSVTLVGVAKGPERRAGLEALYLSGSSAPFILPSDSAALHLVQQIRDEAHRFAITGHRQRRDKKRTTSILESIVGVGQKRRQQLLKQFGGLQQLARAGVEDIARIDGISRELAQRIYDAFHGEH